LHGISKDEFEMKAPLFSIYRSSAGSGKTRTLAKEYLKLALGYRASYFKHILAVTFTNKSTQEMKGRILKYLNDFAIGNNNDLEDELKLELNLDDNTLQQYSQEVQREILHNYSQFSISTIDAFFQRVIRSFTREAGIMGDYTLEMDQQKVIDEVIDQLIEELGSNEELSKWIIQFTEENLEEGKSWDVRRGLKDFTKHIFKEEFKLIEQELIEKTADKNYFQNLLRELQKERSVFINTIVRLAKESVNVIHESGFSKSDFKYSGGPYKFLCDLQNLNSISVLKELGVRPQREYLQAENWPDKNLERKEQLKQLANDKLVPALEEILAYREKHLERCLSAELVLKNFYAFGLIADISRKLAAYKKQNNIMLIADAPSFLSGLIQDSDTPFVYEKVGSFYKNYLIDEFQDTSLLQWKNFLPLLKNSLDQGYPGMVVGDVKQSIYRWRGGDLRLLQNGIEAQIGREMVKTVNLQTNYRSAVNVISFNNLFFKDASKTIERLTLTPFASEAFEDVAQQIHHRDKQGYVQLKFFVQENKRKYNNDDGEEEENNHWKSQALDYMVKQIEALQEQGVAARDIALLVRKGEDGKEIAAHLLQYKENEQSNNGCNYEVLSNESLQLSGAASINLLCAAMRMLLRWDDPIARAQLAFEYQRLLHPDDEQTILMVMPDKEQDSILPKQFVKESTELRKMPLYELAENLIQIFSLHTIKGELPYQFAFLDLILDFAKRERSDLMSFLGWWEDNKDRKSLQLSESSDAMRIITIHKAKGLQFKYVIIPFCNWCLDHEKQKGPILWAKSSHALFKDKGYLPVQYEKAMEQSCFADEFREERIRAYLDNLNLLYVALTRAEQGMILISPVSAKLEVKSEPTHVAQLLFAVINQHEELAKHWKPETLTFEMGKLQADTSKALTNENDIQLTQFARGSWAQKIVVKQSGKQFYEPGLKSKIEKIQYGIKVHEVLSRIKLSSDLSTAIQDVLAEGLINKDEVELIKSQIEKLLANPQVGNWFTETWKILNEASILLPEGKELRVDRLLLRDKKAVVIDYKTGDKKPEDKTQVNAYMLALRNMNYAAKGYLIYLEEEGIQIEEVKAAADGKENQDQLSLNL
jgi:ATP-dependent helicase/nuclease subunit A